MTFYPLYLTLTLLTVSNVMTKSFVHSHDVGYHNHDVEDHYRNHHHENPCHDRKRHHRGLRLVESPIVIGNRTFANKRAFIQSGHRCGSRKPTSADMKKSDDTLRSWITNKKHRMTQAIVVPTYFHVMTDGSDGDISNETLDQQINVLNEGFSQYGFTFDLLGTTRNNNADWYNANDESNMKTTLRVGGSSTLNIYFNRANGYLGYATLPTWYEFDPVDDGVVILSGSVPGGDVQSYNLGKTLIHEVGHWLGLYHTFGNSAVSIFACFGSGDGVADTPSQRSATQGCPIGRDSCFFRGGLDPINNYMDYSDDDCMTEFTIGQRDRMLAMWDAYRAE